MISPLFTSLLAATENRILEKLPPIFGVPGELLLPLVLAIVAIGLGIWYGQVIRMDDHGWRLGLIGAAFLGSLAIILFAEYKLGVDLQGGAILVYEVDEKATADNHPQGRGDTWKMSELMQVLKRRLNPDGLKEIVIRPFGPKQIEIVVPEVDTSEIEELKKNITDTGVLRFLIIADSAQRDGTLWETAKAQALDAPDQKTRMDRNVKDPSDPKGERVIGFWADVKRKSDVQEPQPFVEPSIVTGGGILRDGQTGELIDMERNRSEINSDPVQFFARRNIKDVQILMVVDPEIDVRGSDLASASEDMEPGSGRPCISFIVKADSLWKMGELTGKNRLRQLGIVWDNVLESAPTIQSQITQRGQITGDFSQKEVREKVELLRSGSMPVVLYKNPISDDRIGATLGADTVRKGSQAIVISLSLVLAFVVIYYRTAGFIACFALLLNVMLTVALMFALKAPFTLPGLAGLVLTVGMSVDANVLIYERLREELEKGASLKMAIRNGFDKALVTIIDSNVTTLLTAVILYVIGTDQVRGFGMTLILGILTSMFTAIFASRAILEVGEKAYRWQSLEMMKMFATTKIDWMGAFRPAAIASVLLIAIGLAATVGRGAGIFDTDLAGGTSVQFVVNSKLYPDITEADVRKKINDIMENEVVKTTKSQATADVYEKFVAAEEGADGKTQEQRVWKVDSNLEEVSELQDVIRRAFRKDGHEGVQTYGLKIGDITEIQPSEPVVPPAVVPPSIGAPAATPPETPPPTPETPKTETPKTESGKTEEPKTETPKVEAPKSETPKTESPKTEAPKADPAKDEPKAAAPKSETPKEEAPAKKSEEGEDSSGCQDDEKKKDEPKSEEKKADEPKAAEPKAEEKKADEPKTEPAKTETPKADPAVPAVTETPKTETPPAAETDPAKQIPAVDPLVPATVQPPLAASTVRSQVELKLGNTKISGSGLQDRIKAAALKSINKGVIADVRTAGWDGRDNRSFSDWTVILPLPKDEAAKVLGQLEADLGEEPVWQTSSKIGGQVSTDTRWRAIGAIVGSIVGMIVYMWIRFHKISWGIAAAVALAHDALVMLGAIAISFWLADVLGFLQVEEFKISLPVVAAFLTLIGYSVNDTIVIFDRVREIRGKSPELTGQMVNDAVNQTLSRTIITAGTTLLVILILYFLGGSGIHAFAFALVVGVISGSYSTVFIASPLLVYLIGLDQEQGQKKISAPAPKTRGAA